MNFRVEGLDAATPLTLSVTTASGQLLKTEHFDKVRTNVVYTTRLGHAGVYIVQVYLATGEKFATKIVVDE